MGTNFAIQEGQNIKNATKRMKKFLGAKYEKASLKEMTTKLKYLNSDKQF